MKQQLKQLVTIAAFCAAGATAHCNITDGLIAQYLFNGNAIDQTGGGYDGTIHGAQPTVDRFGTVSAAYYFNGSSDYIVGNKLLPDSLGFTISAWIRPDALKSAGIFYDSAFFTPGRDTTLHMYSNGSLETQFSKISDPGPPYLNASGVLAQGVWTHVVATTEPNGITIFVNGTSVATQTQGSHNIGYHSPVYIGAENHGLWVEHFFQGAIDDVRIYNRALSSSEVSTLYQIEAVPEASSTVALAGVGCMVLLAFQRRWR
jgi:hypothetical protein